LVSAGSDPLVYRGDFTQFHLSAPTVNELTVDGFFVIEGVAPVGDEFSYMYVTPIGSSVAESYHTFNGTFGKRIWLHSQGAYRVEIMATGANKAFYRFTVTNTSAENGDFLFPTPDVQADDRVITNLSRQLTAGVNSPAGVAPRSDRDKLKSLHDFVVQKLHYDYASLGDGTYVTKQNALSVLKSGAGVCDGYARLFSALARAAGYRVKVVDGIAGSGNAVNHAWNLVLLDGEWPMIDCTWDDPVGPGDISDSTSTNPASIRWTYFLVPGPNGDQGDHRWNSDRPYLAIVRP
jgi:transglutaminase-like putative cysteine protease